MKRILTLARIDFKLIFRDSSLRSFLVLPIILFALMIWGVPALVEKHPSLTAYLPIILAGFVIENTQLFCFISSMIWIDEKEMGVAKAYGIVPLSKIQFILSRLLFPFLITVLLNVLLLEVQDFYEISILHIWLIAILTGLIVPIYALTINAIVDNRMQGMVYIKALNMLIILPITAFFIPAPFQHIFALLPSHWVFQAVNQTLLQTMNTWSFIIGFGLMWILIILSSKFFWRKHFY
jgi:fluoroquinolone transport system permease protein